MERKDYTRSGVHENYWHVKMSLPINTAAVWYTSSIQNGESWSLAALLQNSPFLSSNYFLDSSLVLFRVTQSKGLGWSDHHGAVWQCERYFRSSQTQQQHLRALPGTEVVLTAHPSQCSTWLTQLFVGSESGVISCATGAGWDVAVVLSSAVPAIPSAHTCSLITFQQELSATVQGVGFSISP